MTIIAQIGAILSPAAVRELRDFGGLGVKGIIIQSGYPQARRELQGADLDFLCDAQNVHDDEENWPNGRFAVEKLDALAEKHGLRVVRELLVF